MQLCLNVRFNCKETFEKLIVLMLFKVNLYCFTLNFLVQNFKIPRFIKSEYARQSPK